MNQSIFQRFRSYLLSRGLLQHSIEKLHPEISSVIKKVIEQKLTYLPRAALYDLAQVVVELRDNNIEGAIVEAGCALGGSGIVMAASKQKDIPLLEYDVFGMIPPPSAKDGSDVKDRYEIIKSGQSSGIRGDTYYGYQENLYEKVVDNFRRLDYAPADNSITLVKGLYNDTLYPNQEIALAHIDCDWYEPVMTCLERIVPFLVKGGVIVVDDYFAYSGCRRAVDDFFSNKDISAYRFLQKSRLHIVKNY